MFALDLNGLGSGSATSRLIQADLDPAVLRPWADVDTKGRRTGRSFITVNVKDDLGRPIYKKGKDGHLELNSVTGRPIPVLQNVPVTNAPALLRQEDWLRIDRDVQFAAKQRLRF